MAIRGLIREWAARLVLIVLLGAVVAVIAAGRGMKQGVEIHARMPEQGGWLPDQLAAKVGVPLMLRLSSDDVMHGFAVGQQPWPSIDVKPGQVSEISLTFDLPGTYTFYCTRWCGPNHWRMRGTIEVTGESPDDSTDEATVSPRYLALGIDIDAPHEARALPPRPLSYANGERLYSTLSPPIRPGDVYWELAPSEYWQLLREDAVLVDLSDAELWDLIAYLWRSRATPESVRLGERLYAENCAACHGENGEGNGPMGRSLTPAEISHTASSDLISPRDFTDSSQMLGATSALLEGKILRGGMGTGMPYWGTIFTNDELEALVNYLWTFQFPIGEDK